MMMIGVLTVGNCCSAALDQHYVCVLLCIQFHISYSSIILYTHTLHVWGVPCAWRLLQQLGMQLFLWHFGWLDMALWLCSSHLQQRPHWTAFGVWMCSEQHLHHQQIWGSIKEAVAQVEWQLVLDLPTLPTMAFIHWGISLQCSCTIMAAYVTEPIHILGQLVDAVHT